MSWQQTVLYPTFAALLVALVGCAATPSLPTPETPDLASALDAASSADTAVIALTQPCCDKQTLPDCLGITGACNGVCTIFDRIRNRLGMFFPGLEAKPELLAITDPANMSEDSPPAVKAAAEIKAQEDAAAQKIKALRYLASIGCGGCYPDVEDALLAAMDDCTEEVRYEAVLAVRATTGKNCCFCSHSACCSKKVQDKLIELAYTQQGPCCPEEPSGRVRRQARLALAQCDPPVEEEEETPDTPEEIDAPAPTEGPSDSQEAPGDRTTGAPNRRYQAAANYGPQQTTQLVGYNASQRSNSAVQTASQPRVLPPVISR